MLCDKHPVSRRTSATPRPIPFAVQSIDEFSHFASFPLTVVICPENPFDPYSMHIRHAPVARARGVNRFSRYRRCTLDRRRSLWRVATELVVQGARGTRRADSAGRRRGQGRRRFCLRVRTARRIDSSLFRRLDEFLLGDNRWCDAFVVPAKASHVQVRAD